MTHQEAKLIKFSGTSDVNSETWSLSCFHEPDVPQAKVMRARFPLVSRQLVSCCKLSEILYLRPFAGYLRRRFISFVTHYFTTVIILLFVIIRLRLASRLAYLLLVLALAINVQALVRLLKLRPVRMGAAYFTMFLVHEVPRSGPETGTCLRARAPRAPVAQRTLRGIQNGWIPSSLAIVTNH